MGIIHFGIGAFHRAHQAWYNDSCLSAGATGWMICGVSLRSGDVAAQLNPQDGLYTITERSAGGDATRAIGAVREVLVAEANRAAIVDRIASPDCHIVSFTVTEKGYCRAPDGSLDRPLAAMGFYPILADALERRRATGLSGLTLLSCDNLSGNGKVLGRLMRQWLADNPTLLAWFDATCTTPDSMVDRIVPATTAADIATLESRTGLRDEGAVFSEPFCQWVIEDDFAGPRPPWEDYGAQIVSDVTPYETAKLRMLNGAHSLLAYCGLAAGHSYVHEAIADPYLKSLADALMLEEAAPTIPVAAAQDLASYGAELVRRSANPALQHRLVQIAMDGSQKLPQRWLATLSERRARGLPSPAIEHGMTCWLQHLAENRNVDDPLAASLVGAVSGCSPEEAWTRVFGRDGLVPIP